MSPKLAWQRRIAAHLMALMLASTAPAAAVEIRTIDGLPLYAADLLRAYAPCEAPNEVTLAGHPACAPPVTSACTFDHGRIEIRGSGQMRLWLDRSMTQSELCRDGDYRMRAVYRSTFPSPEDPACASGICTARDTAYEGFPFHINGAAVSDHGTGAGPFFMDANFEVLGVTVIAPDGLPMAAAALGVHVNSGVQSLNLSVGYTPCTDPGSFDACDAVPWDSPCDFISGTIAFSSFANSSIKPSVHQISGSSPLCTAGTYQLETRTRATMDACGSNGDLPCTLTDTTLLTPIPVNGPELSTSVGLGLTSPGTLRSAEMLGFRLIDPTGHVLAAAATTNVETLGKVLVTLKDGHLRIRALLPTHVDSDPSVGLEAIDPSEDDGMSFTLHDRNGVILAVDLPGPFWQLQPPAGERWEYKDKGGSRAGVRKVRVKLLKKRGVPLGYDVRLAADAVDLSGADLGAVTLTITSDRRQPDFYGFLKSAQATRPCKVKGTKRACE